MIKEKILGVNSKCEQNVSFYFYVWFNQFRVIIPLVSKLTMIFSSILKKMKCYLVDILEVVTKLKNIRQGKRVMMDLRII